MGETAAVVVSGRIGHEVVSTNHQTMTLIDVHVRAICALEHQDQCRICQNSL